MAARAGEHLGRSVRRQHGGAERDQAPGEEAVPACDLEHVPAADVSQQAFDRRADQRQVEVVAVAAHLLVPEGGVAIPSRDRIG
jgi:hypothetical protein